MRSQKWFPSDTTVSLNGRKGEFYYTPGPTHLPFWPFNSPMCFQNLMSKVLKDLNWKIALVCIDDILIFPNFDQHLKHLGQVFQNLSAANLKAHPGKCKFAAREIKYLEQRWSSRYPSKFSAAETYPVPKMFKMYVLIQLRSTIGFHLLWHTVELAMNVFVYYSD